MNRALPVVARDRSRATIVAGSAVAILAVGLGLLATENPKAALVAVVGGIALAVSIARVEFPLLLLVASAPLEDAFQISANPLITVTKLLGLLCFASFVFQAIAARRKLRLDGTHAIVFGLLGLALVSTVQAHEGLPALTTTLRYASFVALYLVITQFRADQGMPRRIAWAVAIAATIAAWLAILRFLSGRAYAARLHYGDPNDLAFALATTLPLTLWLLGSRRVLRPLVVAMLGLTAAAMLMTFSRGALVGVGAGILWELCVERRHVRLLLGGAVVAVIAAIIVVQVNPNRFRIGLRGKERVAAVNVETRIEAWTAALDLATRHPLVGIGPGNFEFYYLQATESPAGSPALGVVHDAYLDVAAELGFVGMGLFVLFLAASFTRLSAARRLGRGPPGFAAAVRTALVVAIAGAVTLSEQYFQPFWLLGGLATVLWASAPETEGGEEAEPVPAGPEAEAAGGTIPALR